MAGEQTLRIALLQGDGIGAVLADFWARALESLGRKRGFAADCRILPFGKESFRTSGAAVPAETLDGVRDADAALLFAVDSSGIPGPTPVGTLRRELSLFADVRLIKSRPGGKSFRPDIDLVFVRECSEGFLSDRNLHAGNGEWMPDENTAHSLRLITRRASERIARFAFEFAEAAGRKKITALHKASIFKMTCGLFLESCRRVSDDFPGIALDDEVADNAANGLIARPDSYDVLLTTNLFGDILSDEAAALVSSLAPSANFGDEAAVFLPVSHGPDYEGLKQGRFDPMPSALCVAMMLDHLRLADAARDLERIVSGTLAEAPATAERAMDRLLTELKAM